MHSHTHTHTHTHTEKYVILLFHGNSGFANASKCSVIRILTVLFGFTVVINMSKLKLTNAGTNAQELISRELYEILDVRLA